MVVLVIITLLLSINPLYSDGTSAGILLDTGIGARPVGMGEAFVGLSDDINALHYNIAGLSNIKGRKFSAMYLKGLLDVYYGSLGYTQCLGTGRIALSLITLDGGDIEINYSDGTSEHRKAEQDYLLSIGYAWSIVDNLSVGAVVKGLQSELVEEAKASAFAMDLGAQYIVDEKIRVGLSIQNIGSEMTYKGGIATGNAKDPLPFTVRAGVGSKLLAGENFLLIGALDLVKPRQEGLKVHLGFEYWYRKMFAWRIGYLSKYDVLSYTMGVGLNYKNYSIDYGMTPMGGLGLIHRISLTTRF